MTAWRLAALLALSLDLAWPALPGAFAFAPEECTEAVRQSRWLPTPPAVLTSVARPRPPAPNVARLAPPRATARRRPLVTHPPSALMAPVKAESPAADD